MRLSWRRNFQLLWAARGLGAERWWKIFSLARLYQELDDRLEKFRAKTGLGCLPGCGKCCVNPYVETGFFEMLPVANELWRRGKIDHWLKRVLKRGSGCQRGCIFFRPHPLIAGNGRCGIYPLRPLTCRLYGFSARRDKFGAKKLETCDRIRSHFSGKVATAQDLIAKGLDIPVMVVYRDQVRDLGRGMDTELYPINVAFRKAVEKIGLWKQLQGVSR